MVFLLQILCIMGMVGAGFVARRRGMLSAHSTHDLARVALSIIYPALIFSSITQLHLADLRANILLPLLTMCIAVIGLVLGLLLVRLLGRVPPETARAFLFHCLINNYLFLPLPLVLFLYGDKGVALLIFASVGYELMLWSIGVMLFNKQHRGAEAFRSLFSPPLLALLTGIGWIVCRDAFSWPVPPEWLHLTWKTAMQALAGFGSATIALSMLVAGSRFAVLHFPSMLNWRIWFLSAIRLLAIPLLTIALLRFIPLDPISRNILVIIAVMPSAMVSVLFSERYGGDTDFIVGGLLLTHFWALITVPVLLNWAL